MEFYENTIFWAGVGIAISSAILYIAYKNYSHGKTRFLEMITAEK